MFSVVIGRIFFHSSLSALAMRLRTTFSGAFNRFVEWTHNGGQRGRYSSMLSAPLRPIHGQR